MKTGTIIGLLVLALVWLVLVAATFMSAEFTLRTLLVILMSGIIIFVPIWKKYFRK